jgi:hypothetical protein
MRSFVFGADIGKNMFHLVCLDKRGAIAPRYLAASGKQRSGHGGAHVEKENLTMRLKRCGYAGHLFSICAPSLP